MLRFLRRLVLTILLLAPGVAALAWTCQSAARAAWAVASLKPVVMAKADWTDPDKVLEVRRQLQKHFLAHATYVPLEDIVAVGPRDADQETPLLMQKACGHGRLFIWIPFKFKLPITGEKVLEWCWKPQTKDV